MRIASANLVFIFGLLLYISCQKEISYDGGQRNLHPVARAGNDTVINYPVDSVSLDGTSSFDPDGTITGFLWAIISGPAPYSIGNANNSITRLNDLDTGIYRFELKVTDNHGLSSKDTVMITVDGLSTKCPPVADAGYDQVIIFPERTGSLNGVLSYDLDNDIVSYTWTKISGPSDFTIADRTARQTTAADLAPGIYLFELTVTDATGLFSKDTVRINVRSSPIIPPVADAGTDAVITYNLQTCSMNESVITLNGSASYDPDGTILKYQWSFAFTDNSSVIISNPNAAITSVTNLAPGNYRLKLEVTDNDGATDTDTVFVTTEYINRPVVNARLVPIGTLPATRKVSAVASANGKILFAAGISEPVLPGANYSSQVDIYDIATGSWSGASLSMARTDVSAATMGNKIFFSGGTAPGVGPTSRVDVYDAANDLWSTMDMPHAGARFGSIAYDGKLYVAGGNYVNIYDERTRQWTTQMLSQYRTSITPMLVRNIPNVLLHFIGGIRDRSSGLLSSRIDICDAVANTWSTAELNEPKFGMIATSGIMAGGTTPGRMTNKVTGISGCLFQPNSFSYHSYGKVNSKLVFFVWDGKAKNKFDIFDISSDAWLIGVLDQAITPSLIIAVDNIVYVVGAYGAPNGYYNQVWKLEF